jgi:hypothetical protein
MEEEKERVEKIACLIRSGYSEEEANRLICRKNEKEEEHPLELLIGTGETPVGALNNLQPDPENILIERTKMMTGIVLRRARRDGKA